MEFPEPVIRVAIEPKTKAGQEKMGIALAKLAEEDVYKRQWYNYAIVWQIYFAYLRRGIVNEMS